MYFKKGSFSKIISRLLVVLAGVTWGQAPGEINYNLIQTNFIGFNNKHPIS